MGKSLLMLLLALCVLTGVLANKDTYSKWEKYLEKNDYSQGEPEPYWKNYRNWNHWVNEKGSSVSSLPSKEGLDSWRKWNLEQESNNKDWRSTQEKATTREDKREVRDAEWKEWAENEFVRRYAPGNDGNDASFSATDLSNTRVEKDYPSHGSKKDSDSESSKKDSESSKEHAPASWEGEVPPAYQGIWGNKRLTPEQEKARQEGAVDWRTYVPKGPDGTSYADKYYHNKYYNSKKGSNWRNDWVNYLPRNEKDEAEDWEKYAADNGKDNDKYYSYENKYYKRGGGRNEEDDYDRYSDWRKYAGFYGGYGGWGIPETLVAKPSTKNDKDAETPDKREYIPEDYRHFVPNDTQIEQANSKDGQKGKDGNNQGSNVDWRQYVPEEYRHFIPADAGKNENENEEDRYKPRHQNRNERNGPPRTKQEYERRKKEQESKKDDKESSRQHEKESKKEHEKESKKEHEKESKKEHEKEARQEHEKGSSKPHKKESNRQHEKEASREHEKESSRQHEKGSSNHGKGSSRKDDKGHGGKKSHKPHELDVQSSNDQDQQLEEQTAAAFSESFAPTTTTTNWSGFIITLIVLTVLVMMFAGGYMFKKLKKRHCDYQPVEEMDIDRLLYV